MGMRLYLVEDNPLILENLQETLREIPGAELMGHSASEPEAVDWLNTHSHAWDWVVVDLFLKAGTGLGVLANIGRMQPLKKMLVLSNYAGQEIRQQCLRLGAHAVFDKTQEIDRFTDFIRRHSAPAHNSP
ncbi:MAG: response regulator [Brachymonas sp.]|jgi:two-component system OmpR family response regulator